MKTILIPRAHRIVSEFDVIEAFQDLWGDSIHADVEMKSRNDRNTGEQFWEITVTIDHDGENPEINDFFERLNHSSIQINNWLKCYKHPEQPPCAPSAEKQLEELRKQLEREIKLREEMTILAEKNQKEKEESEEKVWWLQEEKRKLENRINACAPSVRNFIFGFTQ